MNAESQRENAKRYWETNIRGFAGFYDRESEENINASSLVSFFYRKAIFPIEKKYMAERYNMVLRFIDDFIKPGMLVADIGCGSGIYTKILVNRGAKVIALDFAQNALEMTEQALTRDECMSVTMLQRDITIENIPDVDVALAIGVVPYIKEPCQFFSHVLPHTGRLLFNFLDANHLLNAVRRRVPFLDVRGYHYHRLADINETLNYNSFSIRRCIRLATGMMLDSEKTY